MFINWGNSLHRKKVYTKIRVVTAFFSAFKHPGLAKSDEKIETVIYCLYWSL